MSFIINNDSIRGFKESSDLPEKAIFNTYVQFIAIKLSFSYYLTKPQMAICF